MNKFDLFWAALAILFLTLLFCFLAFVTWVYYDAAMTLRATLMIHKRPKPISIAFSDDDWKDITFEEIA